MDFAHRLSHPHGAASFLDHVGRLFPHLTWPQRRIPEMIHQRLDHRAIGRGTAQQTAHDWNQRQPADALCRPIGTDLTARYAPYLFGVGFEENLVEAASKRAYHPVLEASDVDRCLALYSEVADETA